ncbi:Rop family plasmid primer RNA-binding protein, partial [Leucobacter iarius]
MTKQEKTALNMAKFIKDQSLLWQAASAGADDVQAAWAAARAGCY